MGTSLAQALVVGDTFCDVLMAQTAGVRCAAVGWGDYEAAELRRAGAPRVVQRSTGVVDQVDGGA